MIVACLLWRLGLSGPSSLSDVRYFDTGRVTVSVVWQSLFVTSRPPTVAAHFGELAAKAAYGIGKRMEQWH
jgi:hypothetical protein